MNPRTIYEESNRILPIEPLPNPEKEETRTYNFENIEDEDDIWYI